jgi:hypothetical protein
MAERRSKRQLACTLILAGAGAASWCARAPATDFIRGDANGDGSLSIADAYTVFAHIYLDRLPIECAAAADARGDGGVNLGDLVTILSYLFLHGPEPAPPFPAMGPDPEPVLPCASYGSGGPIEDPAARLQLLDATAAGGENRRVRVTVAVSSSRDLGGLAGSIRADVPIDGSEGDLRDVTGRYPETFHAAPLYGESLRFGFLSSLYEDLRIPAGTSVSLVEISFCLGEGGTAAGEYPLTLEEGELVDAETGQVIRPALVSGVLLVLSDVPPSSPCPADEPGQGPPAPEDVNVELRLGSAVAGESRELDVPVVVRSNVPVQGFALSVDFDEDVLEAASFSDLWQKPDGTEYGFERFRWNNEHSNPGNGLDEGVVALVVAYDLEAQVALPAHTDNEIVRVHFNVRPGAEGVTELRFLDGGMVEGQPPVNNRVTAHGQNYTPQAGSSFVFISGFVNVLPDGTLFIRGDSNGDGTVNISDPQHTLGYLFLGDDRPFCYDAADSNDDGAINMSDPIATFGFLFLGGGSLPAPHGAAGEDPTPDGLGCLRRSGG